MNRRNLLGSLFLGVLALCGLKRAEASPVADSLSIPGGGTPTGWSDEERELAVSMCYMVTVKTTPLSDSVHPMCPTALMYGDDFADIVEAYEYEKSLPPAIVTCIERNVPYFGMRTFTGNWMVNKILSGGWDIHSAKDRADLRQCWADLKATDPEVDTEAVRDAMWSWYKVRHPIDDACVFYNVYRAAMQDANNWALA